jgi:hypothetical protein
VVLVNLLVFLFFTFLSIMLRLSLVEIAIELVPPRTTFYIILLIIITIIKIAEVLVTLLCPKRVFLLLLFSIDEIGHLSASPFSKLHVANG